MEERCEFCERFDFSKARIEINKYGVHIYLALGNGNFPKNRQFKFCPNCGKELKENEKEK